MHPDNPGLLSLTIRDIITSAKPFCHGRKHIHMFQGLRHGPHCNEDVGYYAGIDGQGVDKVSEGNEH